MSKEEIKKEVKKKFEEEDELVFRAGRFSHPNSEEKLLSLADEGLFYCETVLRCKENHPTIRTAGPPKSVSRPRGMPFCSLCNDRVSWRSLQQDVKFILSEEARDDIKGEG